MTELDEAWSSTQRETIGDVERRIGRFLDWLVSLPYQRIVVVSHGVWMECLLRQFNALPNGQRVFNTDAYAMKLHHTIDSKFTGASHIEQIYSSVQHMT
jgi:broad specificity phosphatase PhoE